METQSHWKTVTHISQSATVDSTVESLEQGDGEGFRRGRRARNVPQFFGEVRTHHDVTECVYVEPKTVYVAYQDNDWDQRHWE